MFRLSDMWQAPRGGGWQECDASVTQNRSTGALPAAGPTRRPPANRPSIARRTADGARFLCYPDDDTP
jgi:hypothetical protein